MRLIIVYSCVLVGCASTPGQNTPGGDPVACMHFDDLADATKLVVGSDPIVEDGIEMTFVAVASANKGHHAASVTSFESSSPPHALQTRGLGFVFDFTQVPTERVVIQLNHWGGDGVVGVNGSALQQDNTFTGSGGDPVADWSWEGTMNQWFPLEIVAQDATVDTVTVGGSYVTFVDAVCTY